MNPSPVTEITHERSLIVFGIITSMRNSLLFPLLKFGRAKTVLEIMLTGIRPHVICCVESGWITMLELASLGAMEVAIGGRGSNPILNSSGSSPPKTGSPLGTRGP
jgi:hypothetical protein